MKTYNYDETLALLNSAVEEKGEDFVYDSGSYLGRPGPSCHYAWEGKPDCIVGHVFAKAGVSLDEMHYGDESDHMTGQPADNRGKYSMESAGEVVGKLRSDGVVDFTPKAARLLQQVQSLQDYGTPWGDAVSAGINTVDGLKEHEFFAGDSE